MISSHCSSLANSDYFNRFIIATILLAGVVVGAQTYPNFAQENAQILSFLDRAILIIFTLEASIKILAEGKNPFNYFKNPWNVFDFTIVAACLLEPFLDLGGAFPTGATPRSYFACPSVSYCYPQATTTCYLPAKEPAIDVLCKHPALFTLLHLRGHGSLSFW